ncbi:MAG: HEAT repeat domain-containing protein [Planctomycetes bacterium]|nr:HEAT repeat domain-containing protein [Planctomycetota bacterium]
MTESVTESVFRTLLFVAAAAIAVAGGAPRARAGDEGVFQDPGRSLVEQREAARAVAERVATGDPAEVAAALADPSAWVRDAAFQVLAARLDAAALDRLEPLLGHPDPLVAGALAEVLGQRRHAPARAALERVSRTSPEPVALEAVWALEALALAESGGALAHVVEKRREPRLRADALAALALVDAERAASLARDALRGRSDPVLRIGALTALLRARPAEGVTAAGKAVEAVDGRDPVEARVLHAALALLRGWCDGVRVDDWSQDDLVLLRATVDRLVARLVKVEDGRPRSEVAATLTALTRSGPATADARDWRDWWAAVREGFVPPDAAPPAAAGATTTRVRFHGIPVVSQRLVFAQDVSGGMRGALDHRDPQSPSRLAFSLDELRRVLSSVDGALQVDVAFFATGCRRAAGRLVPAGKARPQLLDFVTRVGAMTPTGQGQGRSNLHDTLAGLLLDERIDTVYLLSEGGPTEGRFVDTERLLRHLERLNAYCQVQVHCLQVTESRPGAKFLRALAERMGGAFHDLPTLLGARR